ncbi:APC family permease [Mycolicibacterium komossense]|uniref:Amino acid permease n=1 Tax=Mycolicibacterium komossense TaxID=1779 RepID=A0ABT3CKR5_9MYCO|nr:APC family permease [Mycolicibacterium komossense]MCV7230029.1 amino acid permease [Mycolicibacterium komossense]
MNSPAPRLRREFSLFSTFSLAFAYMSPIVAVYGVFALAMVLVGPSFLLALPVALLGQYLVSLALGEVASKYPYEGSLYQWAGRLLGPTYGWMTGWVYMWTVLIAMATVAVGGAGYWGSAFGIDMSSPASRITGALIIVTLCTVANMLGRKPLRIMIVVSIVAEVIGSIGLALVLLIFFHVNPISVIFTSGWGTGGFALALALAGWSFLGFESAGAVAEEVQDPRRNVPKALRYSLLGIGAIVLLSSLALVSAIPDLGAVSSGAVADPIDETFRAHLGPVVTAFANAIFALGFTACCLGLQTGISRVLYAFARDRALPASRWLGTLSTRQGVPVNAILVTIVPVAILFFVSGSNVYNVLVSYTIGGWYLTFLMVLVAAFIVRVKRRWRPSLFSLRSWSTPILVLALAWVAFETVNIAWPREAVSGPDVVLQWAVVIVLAAILVLGGIVLSIVRRRMEFGLHDADIADEDDAGPRSSQSGSTETNSGSTNTESAKQ